jgi:hypothetical protein
MDSKKNILDIVGRVGFLGWIYSCECNPNLLPSESIKNAIQPISGLIKVLLRTTWPPSTCNLSLINSGPLSTLILLGFALTSIIRCNVPPLLFMDEWSEAERGAEMILEAIGFVCWRPGGTGKDWNG